MISRTFKTHLNWTKLVIALSLMCSVFSFSALAQDKPMAANALAGLITDLKEVVSKNSPVENDALLIGKKWDARKDLTGKPKSEVIELLYDDVKLVIKDSGVQYQIYSIFSFYKQIPDKQFSPDTQKTTPATSKVEAVKNLIDVTFLMHPAIGIEEELAKMSGTKELEKEKDENQKYLIEDFENALKVNKTLTAKQKSFVRANYDKLIKITDKIYKDMLDKKFPIKQWTKESLEKSYTAKFSLAELNSLVAYFQANTGKQVLKYIRQTEHRELITSNGGKLDLTEADKAEHDKFVATPLGKTFITAYIKEAAIYEKNKAWEMIDKSSNADEPGIYEPANLNKLFNKFVAENYKK